MLRQRTGETVSQRERYKKRAREWAEIAEAEHATVGKIYGQEYRRVNASLTAEERKTQLPLAKTKYALEKDLVFSDAVNARNSAREWSIMYSLLALTEE